MKRWLSILSVLLTLFLPAGLRAQNTTTVVGEIYDSQTGQPVPNVNIQFQSTPFGTSSDDDGFFALKGDLTRRTTMTVSAIGYRTQRFTIEPGQTAGINIALQEQTTQLADLFVTPGTNPADALMERARRLRMQNDLPIDTAMAEKDMAVYVSDIQARQLRKNLWKNLQDGMIAQGDSSYLLPLYHSHSVSGNTTTHAAFLTETNYQILLTEVEKPIDFYRNTLAIYNNSFLSPLAADGNNYYRFYLADSIGNSPDSSKCYIVHFRTKNPFYLTFNGEMVLDSTTCALRHIEATVPSLSGANYLRNMTIRQDFRTDGSPTLQSESVSLLLDFAIKTGTTHLFPTLLILRHANYNEPPSALQTASAVYGRTDSTLMQLDDTPLFRTAKFFAYVCQTGYIPTGTCVEFGHISEILKINRQEMVRVGLPLRTNEKLWKNICLEAYAAYGFGDRAWKGAGMVHFNLPTLRRHILTARYADEYVYSDLDDFTRLSRENASWFRNMGFATALTRTFFKGDGTYNSAVRKRDFSLRTENEWTDHLESQFLLSIGRLGYGEPTRQYFDRPSFRFATLSTTFRLGWKEKKVDLYFRRIHVYSDLPVLYLNGEIGSYRFDNDNNYGLYGKLRFILRHQQPLGIMGQLDYMLEGGLIFGSVPYPLLHIFAGNQSYAYDPYRFSLMYDYRYAADKYVQLTADWNGRGCLFNLIPGIRYLRLRELLTFKLAYGGLSDSHRQTLAFPQTEGRPETLGALTIPYVEIGVGIGNILRIGELYSVWRLTNRDDPVAPLWAVRFRLKIEE